MEGYYLMRAHLQRATRLFITSLTVLSILFTGWTSVALAQSSDSSNNKSDTKHVERITLSPTNIKPDLKPGTSYSDSMTIINDGSKGYDFVVYTRPYSVKGEDYQPEFNKIADGKQSYQWYTLPKVKYHLEPGQRVKVPYTIKVPKGVAPGGYYSVLFAETQPDNAGSIARKKRVGMLTYLTVEGGSIKKSGSVASWQANFYQPHDVRADLRVKNDGNVHFAADVHVVIKDIFGRDKYTYNNDQMTVLPDTTRHLGVDWQSVPPIGLYKVTGNIKFLDNTQQLDSYWVLVINPWVWIVLGIIAAVLILYNLLMKLVFKKSKKRSRHEASKSKD